MKTYALPNGFFRLALTLMLLVGLMLGVMPASTTTASTQTDLVGPAGSVQFGKTVTVLPNGNIVVTAAYTVSANANVGAVYLYNGSTHALISTLTGSTANDQVGSAGVRVLTNGNYMVRSPQWNNGTATQAGAVTWCSGTVGCTGVVSTTNSLVGSTANDQVGSAFGSALTNGNYMVSSPNWTNGAATQAGAATWCDGRAGCTGVVSTTNSLAGSTANDQVGSAGVGVLVNGNYVTISPKWNNGTATQAGALTWCDGTVGCTGLVSTTNSLVGSTINDQVGYSGVWTLTNGNYVVRSPKWNNGTATQAGAATWCKTTGCTGVVSTTNSLAGSTANDQVGSAVTALTNGNYVVSSPNWTNGVATQAGAATWCDGTAGCTGVVSTTNSLVGSTTNDQVGVFIMRLTNGNYVVNSYKWNNGAATQAGASTWCNGTTGRTGVVSTTNSLVGSTTNDQVGRGPGVAGTALTNGNYVVGSPYWNNGVVTQTGASTWCDGTVGCTGVVSTINSLVGSTPNDLVGGGVGALTNGNYVVGSPRWNNGTATQAGAVTWCSGTTGCTGVVSTTNSLVGSTTNDQAGSAGVTGPIVLTNGNYVVGSPFWTNGSVGSAGAVTWCNGAMGCTGVISVTNSLVGTRASDMVGMLVSAQTNGSYVTGSQFWTNGGLAQAGAVTWCSGTAGCTGPITSDNSVLGETVSGGPKMTFVYDSVNDQLVVGRPSDNRVTLFKIVLRVYLPLIRR